MLKKICDGLAAGLLIAAGGSVFLSCENRVVGAIFFSVALLCICYKGYSLYTGKVCYLIDQHSGDYLSMLFIGLLGNIIATFLVGLAVRYAIPSIGAAAETVCAGKLSAQNALQTFIRAAFCGVMVYLSVNIFKEKNTPIAILFCIPTFILSGFEHSVADMFYFAAAKDFSPSALLFLLIVVLGNSFGGLLLPLLEHADRVGKKGAKA